MPTGKIRDLDDIRVCLEFRDSSVMDSRQIWYDPLLGCALYAYRENLVVRCHSSMSRASFRFQRFFFVHRKKFYRRRG